MKHVWIVLLASLSMSQLSFGDCTRKSKIEIREEKQACNSRSGVWIESHCVCKQKRQQRDNKAKSKNKNQINDHKE